MQVFLGTLIIVALSCLLMGLGLIIGGKPLSGGCGKELTGSGECDACPNRAGKNNCVRHGRGQREGDSAC